MAQMNISNTLWNDTKEAIIAFAKQLKDNAVDWSDVNKKYNGSYPNPDYDPEDPTSPEYLPIIDGEFKTEGNKLQDKLNEFFLNHWADWQLFLHDGGLTPGVIDSWKELQDFLEGLPDDQASWLLSNVTRLDNRITAMDIPDGGAYDVSADHVDGGGNYAEYSSLSNALAAVAVEDRKSGMSIRFINSNTGEYEQWRYLNQYADTTAGNTDFLDVSNWTTTSFSTGEDVSKVSIATGVNAGDQGLVKSGDVEKFLPHTVTKVDSPDVAEGDSGKYMKLTSSGGAPASASGYCLVRPIALNPGETFVVNQGSSTYIASDGSLLYETDSEGIFVRSIVDRTTTGGENTVENAKYTNNTSQVMYVGTSTYTNSKKYSIEKVMPAIGEKELDDVKDEIDGELETVTESIDNINESVILGWINAEAFTVTGATYTNGMIDSPVSVTWPDGVTGSLTLTRTDGFVTKVVAVHGSASYDYTITRDSDGYVTGTTIVKNQ